jgi:hypothetical protein
MPEKAVTQLRKTFTDNSWLQPANAIRTKRKQPAKPSSKHHKATLTNTRCWCQAGTTHHSDHVTVITLIDHTFLASIRTLLV